MNFNPSEYQKKIFDFVENGIGNAVINAKAGSGKTTTLVESMKLISNKEKILFVAFNKAIEQELTSRLLNYDNVSVKTYHSLGFSLLRNSLGKGKNIRLNEHKYTAYINNNIYSLSPESITLNKNDIRRFKNNLKTLTDYARFNISQSSSEVLEMCKKYGISPILNEHEIVPLILEWGKNNITEIDYTDMIWMCVENDVKNYFLKYDYIFIDEAQDTSIVQQKLIKKCFKRGTRFIAIGDDLQCINAFAGADKDAFSKLQKEPNTILLDLPITYRCPKKIVDYVKDIVGVDIKASDNAIDGSINFDVNPYEPKDNDMVLCRNAAHLVKLYMIYNRVNKKSYLKGRNIAESFKSTLEQIDYDYLSRDMMCDGVFPRLYLRLFEMIQKEIELTGLTYEDIVTISSIADFIDTIRALEILSEGLIWKEDLIRKIDTIFSDETKEGVCLSTIHKAKGLEADNVYILCKSLMPSKHAKQEWEKIAEENLIYVAITRAKKTLNYISEKLFSPNLSGMNVDIIDELEYNRKRMNNALKTNINPSKVLIDREAQISLDADKIMNIHGLNSKKNMPKKKRIGANKMSKFL
jgi:superfamily I DNA/RNA helicase